MSYCNYCVYLTAQYIKFLLPSSDGMRFNASTYKGTEGDSISVTLVADAITTCLRNFTVSVTSRDGSATSECHAAYYSQTNLFSGSAHV